MIKTYDEWGYRVTWLEEWKKDLDYVYINGYDCINEANSVEIMLGKQYQQIAGAHRNHLEEDFRWENNMIGYLEFTRTSIDAENWIIRPTSKWSLQNYYTADE